MSKRGIFPLMKNARLLGAFDSVNDGNQQSI